MSNLRKTLKELAQLSLLADKISETQAINLKMFPFVFFEGVKEVKIDYDLRHGQEDGEHKTYEEYLKAVKHQSRIDYHVTVENSDMNEASIGIDRRCKALEFAVREIFWSNMKVKVILNDKQVYESKGKWVTYQPS